MEQKTTWKEYFADKTDDQLIVEAKGLDWVINIVECFGTRDILRLDTVIAELDSRGYDYIQTIDFKKEREEPDEEVE